MVRYAVLLFLAVTPAFADPPVVEDARATGSAGTWRFDVTLSHPDTGWEHYADAWRILDMDGNELGIRVLLHPHEREQPFTRSLSKVEIPPGVEQVQVEARCLVDGWNGRFTTVSLK